MLLRRERGLHRCRRVVNVKRFDAGDVARTMLQDPKTLVQETMVCVFLLPFERARRTVLRLSGSQKLIVWSWPALAPDGRILDFKVMTGNASTLLPELSDNAFEAL